MFAGLAGKQALHFISRSRLLHIFASPSFIEELRLECLAKDLRLPFGTKEGTFAINLGLERIPFKHAIKFEILQIGTALNDHCQIPGIPQCFLAGSVIDPNLVDHLMNEFGAVNVRISFVENKGRSSLKVIFFLCTYNFPRGKLWVGQGRRLGGGALKRGEGGLQRGGLGA